MTFFPRDTLVIGKVKNGFVLRWKGTREEQEDNLNGIFVFPGVGAMCDWLKEKFPDEPKLRTSADILQECIDKRLQRNKTEFNCPYPHTEFCNTW